MHLISLEPLGAGWSVRWDALCNDMVFTSGAKAEAAAMQLGQRLAEVGERTELQVFLRGGALAGRFTFVPSAPVAAPARAFAFAPESRRRSPSLPLPMQLMAAGASAC